MEEENDQKFVKEETAEQSPEEQEASKESLARKKRWITLLFKIIRYTVYIFTFLSIIYISHSIYYIIDQRKKPVYDQDVYQFPKVKKKSPRKVFTTKLFKINLDDRVTTVTTTIILAYDGDNDDLADEILDRKLEIEDHINLNIAGKGYHDLDTADKREFNLKKELLNEINSLLIDGKIEEIYLLGFYISRSQ